MIGEILGDFASALGWLSDAEFFAALGMALFGLAALALTSQLHNRRPAIEQRVTPREEDKAA